MSRLLQAIFFGLLAASIVSCNFPGRQPQEAVSDPKATVLPSTVPAPTFTPSPSPTPTPQPAARVTLGDRALFYGDWETALEEYQTALEASLDLEVQSAARLGIGRTHFLAGDYEQAQEMLENLTVDESAFAYLPEAYFFLAQTLEAQERYSEAGEAYDRYLEYRPGLIDSAVQERRGDALFNDGDYEAAIDAYQAAIQAPHIDQGEELEIGMAYAYELSGDLSTALVAYQDIYNQTTNDYVKAQMDLWIGRLHTAMGNEEEAQAAYLDAVQNYPRSYDAYLALLTLVEWGVPVDEFQRGLVDYYAGQYAVAIAAFDRYLQTDPTDADRVLYYKALASSGLGEHQAAIELWENLIKTYPESEYLDEAWEEKAFTLWYQSDKHLQASQVLEDFREGRADPCPGGGVTL
jgi:soluble lytic murein transglycosylase